MSELSPDQKGSASLIWAEVIKQTADYFPDPRFRSEIYLDSPYYHIYSICSTDRYGFGSRADGIGTKIELAERLFTYYKDPKYFEGLPFDASAMVEEDTYRDGHLFLGITQIIDMNVADLTVVRHLAKGTVEACQKGRFALLNGETAELGYRVSGYGPVHLNWAAVGKTLDNPEKRITGENLKPGQIIVAFEETSMRSNGFSLARMILEEDYLRQQGYRSKYHYFLDNLSENLMSHMYIRVGLGNVSTPEYLNRLMGHDFLEQVLVPWHELEPELAKELLKPSTLYGPALYEALGGVDRKKEVDIIAAAHITGGGIPRKIGRMVGPKELGAHIDTVFADPKGVTRLLKIAQDLPNEGTDIVDDKKASEEWNRGIGFVAVTKDDDDAKRLIAIAKEWDCRAAIVGKILDVPKIEWRGYTWTY